MGITIKRAAQFDAELFCVKGHDPHTLAAIEYVNTRYTSQTSDHKIVLVASVGLNSLLVYEKIRTGLGNDWTIRCRFHHLNQRMPGADGVESAGTSEDMDEVVDEIRNFYRSAGYKSIKLTWT